MQTLFQELLMYVLAVWAPSVVISAQLYCDNQFTRLPVGCRL